MSVFASKETSDFLDRKGIADELLGKKAEERGRKRTQDENDPPLGSRKRSRSSHSSTSVSTISTNLSRSRSPSPRRSKSHRDDAYHTSQRTTSKPPFLKDATRKRQRSSSSSAASYSSGSSAERPPASRHNVDDRNTRRRRSSISPDARGRDRDFYRKRGNRRSSSRNNSMDRSKVARNRNSMTPGIMNSNHDRHNEGRSQHVRDHERRYSNDNERYGRRDEKPAQHAPPPPPIRKERSLSPFSKRLALTQAMNMGR